MKLSDGIAFGLVLALFAAVGLWLTRGSRALSAIQKQSNADASSIPFYVTNPLFQISPYPMNLFDLSQTTEDIGA